MDQDLFKEYLIQIEPNQKEKGYAWHTAIQNIEGQIRVNYNNLVKGIYETTDYLELFL